MDANEARHLAERIDTLLAEASHMGVTLDYVMKLVQQRYAVIHSIQNEE